MASVSSLSGTASLSEALSSQLRLQAAQRNADQAEATARAMEAQASDARQIASKAQADARTATAQADRAEADASQAQSAVAAARSQTQAQSQGQVSSALSQVAQNLTVSQVSASGRSPLPPVVNTQGQVTGVVINTTA